MSLNKNQLVETFSRQGCLIMPQLQMTVDYLSFIGEKSQDEF